MYEFLLGLPCLLCFSLMLPSTYMRHTPSSREEIFRLRLNGRERGENEGEKDHVLHAFIFPYSPLTRNHMLSHYLQPPLTLFSSSSTTCSVVCSFLSPPIEYMSRRKRRMSVCTFLPCIELTEGQSIVHRPFASFHHPLLLSLSAALSIRKDI